jgi:hypothetical protein
MPRVGLEPTIPAFEQAKTVQALHSMATVNGVANNSKTEIKMYQYNCNQPPKEGYRVNYRNILHRESVL